jgi:tetratricopeptide (TPR) repeat protein
VGEDEDGQRSPTPTPSPQILASLAVLVEKSLLQQQSDDLSGPCFYMMGTIREYALERLRAEEEDGPWPRRHADYYRALAEQAEPELKGAGQLAWLARLEQEHDNLRAAEAWLRDQGDWEGAGRLAGAIRQFWVAHSHLTEGRERIETVLTRADQLTPQVRAKAFHGAGVLAWTQGDRASARRTLEESVAVARARGDEHLLAEGTHFLANEILADGDARTARSLADESIALYRRLNCDSFGLSVTLATAGIAAMSLEDYGVARAALEESAAIAREAGDKWALSLPLRNLGIVAFRQGEISQASSFLRDSLIVLRDLRERWFVSRCFETMAAIAAVQGDCERAARLFGAGEILRQEVGASVLPAYRPDYDRGVAALRSSLSEEAIHTAWKAGQTMTLDEALRYALEEGNTARRSRSRPEGRGVNGQAKQRTSDHGD